MSNRQQRRAAARGARQGIADALEPLVTGAREHEEFVVDDGPAGFSVRIVTATGKRVRRYGIWPRVAAVIWVWGVILGWLVALIVGGPRVIG